MLPAELRKELNIQPNDQLIATLEEDGSLRVISVRQAVASMKGILRELLPDLGEDVSLVDELIAERRREAAAE